MLSYCEKHRLYQAGPIKKACPFCEDEEAVAKRRKQLAHNVKDKRGRRAQASGPQLKRKEVAPPDRLELTVVGKPDWAARMQRIEEAWYE